MYKQAELIAQAMELPLTVDSVVLDLYGTKVPAVDEVKARAHLLTKGIRSEPAVLAALCVLTERLQTLLAREGA